MIPTDQRAKMDEDCDKFVEIMKSSISLVCRSAINSKNVVKVEGLLGVTLDDQQILLVNVNELFALTPAGSERKPKKTKGAVGGKSSPSRKPQPRRSKKYQTSDAESAGEQEEHEEVKEEDGGGEETADWTMDQDGMDTTVDTSRTHILLTEEEYSQFTHIDSPVKSQPSTSQGPIPLPTDVKGLVPVSMMANKIKQEDEGAQGLEFVKQHIDFKMGWTEDKTNHSTGSPAPKKPKLDTPESLGTGDFQCSICSKRYTTKEKMLYHQRNICTTEDEPSIPCLICGTEYRNRKAFMSHNLRIHNKDEELSKCNLCCSKSKSRINLKFHYRFKHKIEGTKCLFCNLETADTDELLEHIIDMHKNSTGLYCISCSISFKTKQEFDEHMEEEHVKNQGSKPYCRTCDMHFSARKNFVRHMRNTHGKKDFVLGKPLRRSLKPKKPKIVKPKPPKIVKPTKAQQSAVVKRVRVQLMCPKCGKRFRTKQGYNIHMKLHDGFAPYQCHICAQNFSFKVSLDGHINRHLGIKPYLCFACGESFHYQHTRDAHEARLHKLVDMPCRVCGKISKSRNALKRHESKVHKNLCYFCLVCKEAYTREDDMRDHMLEAHREKPVERANEEETQNEAAAQVLVCSVCQVQFTREEDIQEHFMLIHPAANFVEVDDREAQEAVDEIKEESDDGDTHVIIVQQAQF